VSWFEGRGPSTRGAAWRRVPIVSSPRAIVNPLHRRPRPSGAGITDTPQSFDSTRARRSPGPGPDFICRAVPRGCAAGRPSLPGFSPSGVGCNGPEAPIVCLIGHPRPSAARAAIDLPARVPRLRSSLDCTAGSITFLFKCSRETWAWGDRGVVVRDPAREIRRDNPEKMDGSPTVPREALSGGGAKRVRAAARLADGRWPGSPGQNSFGLVRPRV
jgi:hypothetical protein